MPSTILHFNNWSKLYTVPKKLYVTVVLNNIFTVVCDLNLSDGSLEDDKNLVRKYYRM